MSWTGTETKSARSTCITDASRRCRARTVGGASARSRRGRRRTPCGRRPSRTARGTRTRRRRSGDAPSSPPCRRPERDRVVGLVLAAALLLGRAEHHSDVVGLELWPALAREPVLLEPERLAVELRRLRAVSDVH